MNLERKEMHATVREGYQILLRADAEYLLPVGRARMESFYESLTDTCMKWALEVLGERLRSEFLALESLREKSQFGTRRYRMCTRPVWEEGKYAAFLCESRLTGQWREMQKSYHRTAQVWDLEEETLLPQGEILRTFGVKLRQRMLPFRPDGIYPEGDELVVFRNATDRFPFEERKLPRNLGI